MLLKKLIKEAGLILTLGWLIFLVIPVLGLSYSGLRLMSNYEESILTMLRCESKYIQTEDAELFSFTIYTDKLDYPITVSEGVSRKGWYAVPSKDWCVLENSLIYARHFDKLRIATAYDSKASFDQEGGVSLSRVLIEFGGFFSVVIVCVFLVDGLVYFINEFTNIVKIIKRDPDEAWVSFLLFKLVRHVVTLIAVGILAAVFLFSLGLAVLRGMLYIEGGNIFLTGSSAFVGLALISYGPAAVFRFVYLVRTSSYQPILLVRDMFFLAGLWALSEPVLKLWEFSTRGDMRQLPMETLGDLVKQIADKVIS